MHSDDGATSTTEAVRELVAELSALRVRAGAPSLRMIASRTGGKISHTTAADVFSGRRVPSWPVVAAIVEGLGGDEQAFRSRWVAATDQSPTPTAPEREDVLFITQYRRLAADYFSSTFPGASINQNQFFDIYEPPKVTRLSDSAKDKKELDLAAFDDEIRHTLLLGEVASGKTMLCQALMLRHALDDTQPAAFLVPLRRFAAQATPDRSVVGFIEHNLESVFQLRPPTGLIGRHLKREATLVILDGLDELFDSDRLIHVTSVIRLFSARYPLARILVTSADLSHGQGLVDSSVFTTYLLRTSVTEVPAALRKKHPALSGDRGTVPTDVLAALKTIRELLYRSTIEPALGLHALTWSWGTLENCLAGILQEQDQEQSDIRRASTRRELYGDRLIAEAEARGLIAPEDAERLRPSWALRNQVIHGHRPSMTIPNPAINEGVEAVVQVIYHLYEGATNRR